MPKKKYIVRLSAEEREYLRGIIKKRSAKSLHVRRASALLAADVGGDKVWTDDQISQAYQMSRRMVERLRQRLVEEGIASTLEGHKYPGRPAQVIDGRVEAHLVALRCAAAPEGYSRWSLRLLAEKMVELEYVDHISHETVRQVLKKTRLSLGV